MSIKKILISISCVAISLPLGASSIAYNSPSNTYYVGMEDAGIGGPMSGTSDYDYNDLIFSLTGTSTLTLEGDSGSSLFPPVTTVTPSTVTPPTVGTPPAFWNNTSYDGPGLNFGQCLYTTTTCGGPFDPTSSYLAESGTQLSSNFYFTGGGTVTITVLANIANNPLDITGLEYCLQGSTTCTPIAFTPNSVGGTFSFTAPIGGFDLAEVNNPGTFYDSETTVTGVTDSGFNHFAVAVGTPEPGTLAVVGSFLVGLGVLRRRRSIKKQ